jgi:hypothetical protein
MKLAPEKAIFYLDAGIDQSGKTCSSAPPGDHRGSSPGLKRSRLNQVGHGDVLR